MKKLLQFFSLSALALVVSCVDPNTVAIANGTTNAGITGPRILEKVISNNQNIETYNSTGGVVNSFEYKAYNGTTVEENQQFTVTYSGDKVTKLQEIAVSSDNPGVTYKTVVEPTYNSAGKIISSVKDTYNNNVKLGHILGEITYDSSGKITKIFEKIGIVSATGTVVYAQNRTYQIYYSGENVTKIEEIANNLNSAGVVVSFATSSREFSQFDSQFAPYSTLSKDLKTCLAIIEGQEMNKFSVNNPLKEKFIGTTNFELTNSYQYDPQGYAISINGYKYSYKPL